MLLLIITEVAIPVKINIATFSKRDPNHSFLIVYLIISYDVVILILFFGFMISNPVKMLIQLLNCCALWGVFVRPLSLVKS